MAYEFDAKHGRLSDYWRVLMDRTDVSAGSVSDMGIALLIFNRTTVPRTDKRMEEAGCSKEVPVDDMGPWALLFSDVLALGFLGINSSKYPFINGELVNRYATT